MPRIRSIKPEFWSDEKLARLSPITRLVFLGLIGQADDAGRLLDNTKVIDAFIFPETSETSRGSIDELSALGRIQRGLTESGQRIIQITSWKRHQKIEKPNLAAALPEIHVLEVVAEIRGDIGDSSGKAPRLLPGSSVTDLDLDRDLDRDQDLEQEQGKIAATAATPTARERFLAEVPTTRRSSWAATLDGWESGLGYAGGRAAEPADIEAGLIEYLAAPGDRDFSARHVVKFVMSAERRRTTVPSALESMGNGRRGEPTLDDKFAEIDRRRAAR